MVYSLTDVAFLFSFFALRAHLDFKRSGHLGFRLNRCYDYLRLIRHTL